MGFPFTILCDVESLSRIWRLGEGASGHSSEWYPCTRPQSGRPPVTCRTGRTLGPPAGPSLPGHKCPGSEIHKPFPWQFHHKSMVFKAYLFSQKHRPTSLNFHWIGFKENSLYCLLCLSVCVSVCVCDMWQVTSDMWHLTYYMVHVTCDILFLNKKC